VDFDGGMKKAGSMKCKIRIQKKKMIGEWSPTECKLELNDARFVLSCL
jgi:hypothetical protein